MRLFVLSLLAISSVHSLSIGYPYQAGLLAYSPARGEFPVQSTEVLGYLRYFDNNGVEHLLSYSHPEPTLGVRHVGGIYNPIVRSHNIDLATYPKAIEEHFRGWITVQYKALRDEIYALKAQGKEPSADMLIRLQPLEKIYQTADFSTIAELPQVKHLFDEYLRICKVKTEILRHSIGETNLPLVPAGETPEQKLAREEHLRIYNEQVARVLEAQREEIVKATSNEAHTGQTKIAEQQSINRLADQADGITEVERATQEHLRLWNEAKLRAEEANHQQEAISKESGLKSIELTANKQAISETVHHLHSAVQEQNANAAENSNQVHNVIPVEQQSHLQLHSVVDTPEVMRARDEHLRLVDESRLRAETAEQEELKQKQLRTSASAVQHEVQHHSVADTSEVVRARDEHIRLVDEARLRAESVEQEELKHKQFVDEPLLTTSVHAHIPNIPHATQPGPISDTLEVVKAREEHLRLFNEAQRKVQGIEQSQNVHYDQPQVADTPEVIKAREEHLRILNAIKAHAEQEQAIMTEIKASGIELKIHNSDEDAEKIEEQERLNEEARLLELERIREATRLQDEQKQLEVEQLRDAERFAEEQRQMEAEIKRLQLEEEQRFEMEKLIESRRLKAEQEQTQQIIITEELKPTDGETQQPLFFSNPFLTDSTGESRTMQQHLAQQQPNLQHMYVNNPFLKSPTIEGQQQQQHTMTTITVPSESRKIQSSQNSIGTKQQHIKDDFNKHHSIDHAGYQPADTAAVLIHLEKTRQEHFRAHEQVLEQLRLARVHSSSHRDCN